MLNLHEPQRGISLPPGISGRELGRIYFTIHCVMWKDSSLYGSHCSIFFRWWGSSSDGNGVVEDPPPPGQGQGQGQGQPRDGTYFSPITCPEQDVSIIEKYLVDVRERAFVSAIYPIKTEPAGLKSYFRDLGALPISVSVEKEKKQQLGPGEVVELEEPSSCIIHERVGGTFLPCGGIPFVRRWFSVHGESGEAVASVLVSVEDEWDTQILEEIEQRRTTTTTTTGKKKKNRSQSQSGGVVKKRERGREGRKGSAAAATDADFDAKESADGVRRQENPTRTRLTGLTGPAARDDEDDVDPVLDRVLKNASSLYADMATFEAQTRAEVEGKEIPTRNEVLPKDLMKLLPPEPPPTASDRDHDEDLDVDSLPMEEEDLEDVDIDDLQFSLDAHTLDQRVKDILRRANDLQLGIDDPDRIEMDALLESSDSEGESGSGGDSDGSDVDMAELFEGVEGGRRSEDGDEEMDGEEDQIVIVDGLDSEGEPMVEIPLEMIGELAAAVTAAGGEAKAIPDEPSTPPSSKTRRPRQTSPDQYRTPPRDSQIRSLTPPPIGSLSKKTDEDRSKSFPDESFSSPPKVMLMLGLLRFKVIPSSFFSSVASDVVLTARLPPSQRKRIELKGMRTATRSLDHFLTFDLPSVAVAGSLVLEVADKATGECVGIWTFSCGEIFRASAGQRGIAVRYCNDVVVMSLFESDQVAVLDAVVAVGEISQLLNWQEREKIAADGSHVQGREDPPRRDARPPRPSPERKLDIPMKSPVRESQAARSKLVVRIVEGCGFGLRTRTYGGLAAKIGINSFIQFSLFSGEPLKTCVVERSFTPKWDYSTEISFVLDEATYAYLENETAKFVLYHRKGMSEMSTCVPLGYIGIRLERMLFSSNGIREWSEVISLEDNKTVLGMVFLEMLFDDATREILVERPPSSDASNRLLEMCRFGFIIEEMQVPPPPVPVDHDEKMDSLTSALFDYFIQYDDTRTRVYNTTARASRIALHHSSEVVVPFDECIRHLKDNQYEFELYRMTDSEDSGVFVGSCYVSLFPLFLQLRSRRKPLATHTKDYVLVQRARSILLGKMRVRIICEILSDSIHDQLRRVSLEFDRSRGVDVGLGMLPETAADIDIDDEEDGAESDDDDEDYESILEKVRELVRVDEEAQEERSLAGSRNASIFSDGAGQTGALSASADGAVIRRITHVDQPVQTEFEEPSDSSEAEGVPDVVPDLAKERPQPQVEEKLPITTLSVAVLSGIHLPPVLDPCESYVSVHYASQQILRRDSVVPYSNRSEWKFRAQIPVYESFSNRLRVKVWLRKKGESSEFRLLGSTVVELFVLKFGMNLDGWYVLETDARYEFRPMIRVCVSCLSPDTLIFEDDDPVLLPSTYAASVTTFDGSTSALVDDLADDTTDEWEKLNQSLSSLSMQLTSMSRGEIVLPSSEEEEEEGEDDFDGIDDIQLPRD